MNFNVQYSTTKDTSLNMGYYYITCFNEHALPDFKTIRNIANLSFDPKNYTHWCIVSMSKFVYGRYKNFGSGYDIRMFMEDVSLFFECNFLFLQVVTYYNIPMRKFKQFNKSSSHDCHQLTIHNSVIRSILWDNGGLLQDCPVFSLLSWNSQIFVDKYPNIWSILAVAKTSSLLECQHHQCRLIK